MHASGLQFKGFFTDTSLRSKNNFVLVASSYYDVVYIHNIMNKGLCILQINNIGRLVHCFLTDDIMSSGK